MNDDQKLNPPGSLRIPDSFEDAERFKRLFVDPMIDMVKQEMNGHVTKITAIATGVVTQVNGMESRVAKLEGNQKHALLGWGVYSTAVGVATAAAWKWITTKVKIS